MAKSQRSPQEKKVLSYQKDRRNIYGENVKASRKAIPKNKRIVNEDLRRKVKQAIKSNLHNDPDSIENAAKNIKRKLWRKSPDAPLGEVVKRKLVRRINDHGSKLKRRENRKKL